MEYNPLTDKGANILDKALAILSILTVPILFFICIPSRNWVRKAVSLYSHD